MGKTATERGIGMGGIVLALYLHAGGIKSNPFLAWVPIDLTLLLALLLALIVVGTVLRTAYLPHAIWVPILIGGVLALGLIPPTPNQYGAEKVEAFYTLTLLGMFAAAVLIRIPKQRAAFLKTLAALGVVVTLLVTLMPARASEWSDVVTLEGTNTITTSRMILTGAIIILLAAILKKMSKPRRLALIVLAALMILTALNTGSRGPILAAAVAVVLALLFAPVFARRRGRTIFAFALVAGGALFVATQLGSDGLERIAAFLGGVEDTSSGARSDFWELAWYYTLETPTGLGWGAFANIPGETGAFSSTARYPHNMMIEIALEAGLFAAVVILVFLIVTLFRMRSLATTPATVACFALLIFTIANAMLSGDINDNRLMWAMIVAAWAITRQKTPEPETDSAEVPDAVKR